MSFVKNIKTERFDPANVQLKGDRLDYSKRPAASKAKAIEVAKASIATLTTSKDVSWLDFSVIHSNVVKMRNAAIEKCPNAEKDAVWKTYTTFIENRFSALLKKEYGVYLALTSLFTPQERGKYSERIDKAFTDFEKKVGKITTIDKFENAKKMFKKLVTTIRREELESKHGGSAVRSAMKEILASRGATAATIEEFVNAPDLTDMDLVKEISTVSAQIVKTRDKNRNAVEVMARVFTLDGIKIALSKAGIADTAEGAWMKILLGETAMPDFSKSIKVYQNLLVVSESEREETGLIPLTNDLKSFIGKSFQPEVAENLLSLAGIERFSKARDVSNELFDDLLERLQFGLASIRLEDQYETTLTKAEKDQLGAELDEIVELSSEKIGKMGIDWLNFNRKNTAYAQSVVDLTRTVIENLGQHKAQGVIEFAFAQVGVNLGKNFPVANDESIRKIVAAVASKRGAKEFRNEFANALIRVIKMLPTASKVEAAPMEEAFVPAKPAKTGIVKKAGPFDPIARVKKRQILVSPYINETVIDIPSVDKALLPTVAPSAPKAAPSVGHWDMLKNVYNSTVNMASEAYNSSWNWVANQLTSYQKDVD